MPLYIIRARDIQNMDVRYIKIGVSDNPFTRIRNLQKAMPLLVDKCFVINRIHERSTNDFYDGARIETMLHLFFSSRRIRGEWFSLSWEEICQFFIPKEKHFVNFGETFKHSLYKSNSVFTSQQKLGVKESIVFLDNHTFDIADKTDDILKLCSAYFESDFAFDDSDDELFG